jgi:pyruvate/2-oxoglutarate dehydrogenase complex dihydrolipoamide dehydrogenase (E3) component
VSEHEFDVVVIGGGPAGEVCVGRIGEMGLEVALVESHLIGGECSYYACMPSKALLRPGELLAEAKRVPGVSEAVTGEIDVSSALARRDEVIHDLDDSSQIPWLEKRDVKLFRGEGRLDGEKRVVVGDEVLNVRKAVVLATGSGAAMPPIEGLEDAKPWNNREITTAKKAPSSLVILGGGPVGSEMASAWNAFGTDVSLIEGGEHLLGRDEPFAGEMVADALRERGVDVRTGTKAESVRRESGEVVVELSEGDPARGEEILVAVGRKPHSESLGLDSVGVQPNEHGYVEVDDQLRVGGSGWLYAIGDLNGRVLLTHMGKYQARVAADHILGNAAVAATEEQRGSPHVTFTDPQVSAVGKTLDAAKQEGIKARAIDTELANTAGGSFMGKGQADRCRFVVDEERRILVGATFVGFETVDFLHAATIAVVAEVPLDRLWHAVPSFPTRSEIWLELIEEFGPGS